MTTAEFVAAKEGFEGSPYNDSLGIPTIGYGTKLPITEPEALLLLQSRLDPIIPQLQAALPWFNTLDGVRETALVAMAYQLGVEGVLGFHSMLAAIGTQDWQAAHDAALASKWAQQTPERAQETAQLILTGSWPGDGAIK